MTAAFDGLVNLLNVVTLEKAAALVAVGGGFGALALGVGAATAALTLFPVGKLTKALTLTAQHNRSERRPETVEESREESRESQGIRRETIEAAAQSITIKEAQVHASAQQISVEQKATDLSKIEQKIDRVIKAVVDSRPDWNWFEFNRAYSTNS